MGVSFPGLFLCEGRRSVVNTMAVQGSQSEETGCCQCEHRLYGCQGNQSLNSASLSENAAESDSDMEENLWRSILEVAIGKSEGLGGVDLVYSTIIFRNKDVMAPSKPRRIVVPTPSKEEINEFPLGRYEGPITIVETPEAARQAVRRFRGEMVLGFDTESRPSFRKGEVHPVALVQIAGEKEAVLFQVLRPGVADALVDLLSAPEVLKVGVGLKEDVRKLRESLTFDPGGFFDLAVAAKRVGIRNAGLRLLAATFLGIRISKGAQRSNWGRETLAPIQVAYAATDAWVGREVYRQMNALGLL